MQSRKFFVVNLREDQQRWLKVYTALSHFDWIKLERVEGVYGSALPNNVCVRLTGDPYSVIAKGAIGCLLSHVRAWELLAASTDPWAFIGEDDASFGDLDALRFLDFPDNVDLIFVNDRTRPDISGAGRLAHYVPIVDSLGAIERRKLAVGTDGYLITRQGAVKLIGLFQRDGYFSHIDIRLLAYSVSAAELQHRFGAANWLTEGISQIKRVSGADKELTTLARVTPLVSHAAEAETSRTREDGRGRVGVRLPGHGTVTQQ